MTTARSRGFEIDAEHLEEQIKFTAGFLARSRENYRRGRGQGGQATTAGYALGALADGGWKPDAATAAVAEYLLLYQNDLDHWQSVSRRPPSEQSPFTTTYVALRGLNSFGTPDQRERIDRRFEQVRGWLLATMPHDTEDRVFRLRAPCVSRCRRRSASAARPRSYCRRSGRTAAGPSSPTWRATPTPLARPSWPCTRRAGWPSTTTPTAEGSAT